jgi:predicted DNA-binding transcriptional regulator AlpA
VSAPQFWRIDRVAAETGLCTRAIYQGMADGTFPKNFPISRQARAWASDEIEAWKLARLADRNEFDRGAAADVARARRRGRKAVSAKTTEA